MLAHLRRNWLSYIVLIGITLTFVCVEQVRNLFEVPRELSKATFTIGIGLYGYILILSVLYFAVSWWVAPFNLNPENPPQPFAPTLLGRFITSWHWQVAALCALGSAILYQSSTAFQAGGYVVDHTVLLTFSILFAAGAVLALAWNWLLPQSQRLLLRGVIALVGLNILGEVIWYASNAMNRLSPRNYSIWAIVHLAFCAFLAARVVDVWQCYSNMPVRLGAILLAVGAVAFSTPTTIGDQQDFSELRGISADSSGLVTSGDNNAASETFLSSAWLVHVRNRVRCMPPGPVILIAASGGGSRAALFTSLVYDELARMPGRRGSEAGTIADHVLMISSVSGGTLASACYLDEGYSKRLKAQPTRESLRNSIEAELFKAIKAELEQLRDVPWYQRTNPTTGETEDFVKIAAQQIKQGGVKAAWFKSTFADDMCTDFMAPLLRGLIHPGRDRAESVQLFWETRFGLHDTNLDWLRRSASAPTAPALLCNVSEVERGTRLIIGFPPLPPGFFQRGGQRSDLPREWVDLDARQQLLFEVSLADATRMSANFPWGFPIASVAAPQVERHGQSQPDVHLIDGGVRDNTGIDSLRYVMAALSDWAKSRNESSPEDRYRETLAKEIVGSLKERGVLLLEIDSGAKQEPSGMISRMLSGLLEPIDAMQNAAYSSATAAVASHMEVLENHLPNSKSERIRRGLGKLVAKASTEQAIDLLAASGIRNVRRLTITCNHQDNVMTAWALGPTDKAQILARFLAGRARLHYELSDYLEYDERLNAALATLEETVEAIQNQPSPSDDDLSEVVESYKDLVRYSLEAVNMQDLRIASEKMFYSGVRLPPKVPMQVPEEIRSSQESKVVLKTVRIPDEDRVVTLGGEANDSLPATAASTSRVKQYQNLGKKLDETDLHIKRRTQGTFEKIERLSKK